MQSLLVLASLGFLLPFVTVSCQGVAVVSMTGAKLASGTTVGGGDLFQATVIPPNPYIIAALVFGALAFLLGFVARSRVVCLLAALLTALSGLDLLAFALDAPEQVRKATAQAFTLNMEAGFWVSLACYAIATIVGVIDSAQAAPAAAALSPAITTAPSEPAGSGRETSRFCPACGAAGIPGKAFCANCGEPLASRPTALQPQPQPLYAAAPVVSPPPKPLSKKQKWIVAVSSALLVFSVGFYFFYAHQKARPVVVYIHSNMDGEKLFVDGVDYSLSPRYGPGGPAGMPNWELTTTRALHHIRLTHTSAKPWEGDVDPGAFESRHDLNAMLTPITYPVTFQTRPAGATITWGVMNSLSTRADGTIMMNLMSGPYTGTATYPGYVPLTKYFAVSPKYANLVVFDLQPIGQPAATQASAPRMAYSIDPPSNVRQGPSVKSGIICSVNSDQGIPILDTQGDWYKTSVCGGVGYIYRDQVKF